jgi:SNF2 family DNA or RNA helicase
MVYAWSRGLNAILADEMGLGKTIQCVSMIGAILGLALTPNSRRWVLCLGRAI